MVKYALCLPAHLFILPHLSLMQFHLLTPNLISPNSFCLVHVQHQLLPSLMADGVQLLSLAWLIHIWRLGIHATTCSHSPEYLISHRMIKSAWSMSFPHLLCRRMPPLPTTAHFFRGSVRGLSWAEGSTRTQAHVEQRIIHFRIMKLKPLHEFCSDSHSNTDI